LATSPAARGEENASTPLDLAACKTTEIFEDGGPLSGRASGTE
jgi:hypothetical protein